MELKLPFKVRIKYLISNDEFFEGTTEFHNNNYKINIKAQDDKKILKIPFSVIGITAKEMLVRISGPSGVYVQDHMLIVEQAELIEIKSDSIFYEMTNDQEKYDTLEIFVK